MQEIIDYCKVNNYSNTLTIFLINFYNDICSNQLEEYKKHFIKAVTNTKIVLVSNMDDFVNVIKEHTTKFGHSFSSMDETFMRLVCQAGIYLPIPILNENKIERLIVARVNEKNEILTEDDKIKIRHELIHLLRSYSEYEFELDKDIITSKSGVIKTTMKLVNNRIDIESSKKENTECEEKFVGFMGEKISKLLNVNFTNEVFELLNSYIKDKESQEKCDLNAKNELISMWLNLFLISKVYNGSIRMALIQKYSDFLQTLKYLYGEEICSSFMEIYRKPFYDDFSIIEKIEDLFTSKTLN